MTFPNDYTPNTCRALPTNPNYLDFAADCDGELAKFLSDYVTGKDVVGNAPVLVIPGGAVITEDLTSIKGLRVQPANASAADFVLITSDDPANKPDITITNDDYQAIGGCFAFDMLMYSRLYDCVVSLNSSLVNPAADAGLAIMTSFEAVAGPKIPYVGCIAKSINAPNFNAAAGSVSGFSDFFGGVVFVNCAIDDDGSVIKGAACPSVGFLPGNYTYNSSLYNCTAHSGNFDYDIILYFNTLYTKNCIGSVTDFGAGGTLNATTPSDGSDVSLDSTHKYLLTASDAGNGTDLSGDATFAFDDDINGELRDSTTPERGADAYEVVSANTAPDAPITPSPTDGATITSATSVTLSCYVEDDDGDAMDVTFYDASDDSVIGVDSGVASGGTATVNWSGLTPGQSYTWYAIVDDGTDTTQSADFDFTIDRGMLLDAPSNITSNITREITEVRHEDI